MRKFFIFIIFITIISTSLYAQNKEPILYLEFDNLQEFLHNLNQDKNYKVFISSSVLEWFKKTRIGLKFPKRIKPFEDILGFSLSLKNLATFSGGKTGIWLFDIGELKMLFITKIANENYLRSQLAKHKNTFGEARIDSVIYYFRKDKSGENEVDFAFINGNLILSNEPSRFEYYLKKLMGNSNFSEWKRSELLSDFNGSVGSDYDILLYLSPQSINNTYFNSYWFYNNQKEIKNWFERGILTIKKDKNSIEENRFFKTTKNFSVDSTATKKIQKLYTMVPQNSDYIKISPVYGNEIDKLLQNLLKTGIKGDTIISAIKSMTPLCYGDFISVRREGIVPILDEEIAIVVKQTNKDFPAVFNTVFPDNLQKNNLFSHLVPSTRLDGDILLISSPGGISKNTKTINLDNEISYSWMNFENLSKAYEEEISVLKKQDTWQSKEDKDFFITNIDALINTLSNFIKHVEIKEYNRNGLRIQKVTYTTQ